MKDPRDGLGPGAWPTLRRSVDMLNSIHRALRRVLALLIPGVPPLTPAPHPRRSAPAVARPRRLVVSRAVVNVSPQPRPADGPFSQAAFDRWERAENRWRRERRRALWLALHGIEVGPSVIHGVVVR